jgi:hypothetical protein
LVADFFRETLRAGARGSAPPGQLQLRPNPCCHRLRTIRSSEPIRIEGLLRNHRFTIFASI